MEYYKYWLDGKLKYLIITTHASFNIYDEYMKLENMYAPTNSSREKILEKATLVTEENELAKLMLICHT